MRSNSLKKLESPIAIDPRVNLKKNFFSVYASILIVMFITNAGSVLMFNHELNRALSPWTMALTISAYVFFMGFIVSLLLRNIINQHINVPLSRIGSVARAVANGDFTLRIDHLRRDNLKDHVEVLIDDFNKMIEELQTMETLKTDFISNVSHELKTPLAIIQNYITLLKKKELNEEKRDEYLEVIEKSASKLSNLVSNILRLNKLENQEIIYKSRYALDEQVSQCIVHLDELFENKAIDTLIELEPIYLENDAGLIEIAINNLLTNAIKYTEKGGQISVQLNKISKKTCVLIINDTGCGIPKEKINQIFDRFYQGDTSRHAEGNGLGLSMVKRIMTLTHTHIQVQSEVNRGTSVHLYFDCLE